jgi:NADPH-dependent 2,4-dienoyl-CoA reductase/sulfur reductase-like enzyme
VGAEEHLPYDRPPLSKEVLAGSACAADVALRPEQWYVERDVELRLGRAATALRPDERTVVLAGGGELRYERLLVATGSRPRRVATIGAADNVHVLRTLDEALALREALEPGARLAIVGAGFIGQEVAATARSAGVDVTLVEATDLPLAHLLGPGLARWLSHLHASEGVHLRLGATVAGTQGNGRVEALELSGGERLAVDAAVVGVGVEPATEWLRGSGLDPAALGTAGTACVHAAGDAAGGHHWDAAVRQAGAAAHAMLGLAPPPAAPPTFWSDQHGVRLQLVGAPAAHDSVEVHGDVAARAFHAIFRRAGRAIAGLAVGCPHELPRLRRLVANPETEVTP